MLLFCFNRHGLLCAMCMDEVICGQDGVWFPFQWFDTVIGRQEGRPAYKKIHVDIRVVVVRLELCTSWTSDLHHCHFQSMWAERKTERSGQKSGEREWSGERTFHVSRKRLSGSGEWSGRPRSRERMSQTKIGLSAERQIGRSCSAHMLWPLPASHTPLKSTTVCYSGTGLSRLSWKSGR